MIVRRATAADVKAITRVHVGSWRTTYRGIVADEVLDNLSFERREKQWSAAVQSDNWCVYVAEDEGAGIFGFANAGPERSGDPDHKGELYSIYLLQGHQGKGAGRALTLAAARWLLEAGYPSMLVWVLAENPSRRFYEAMGGRYLRAMPITIGDRSYEEVAYGWADIRTLIRANLR